MYGGFPEVVLDEIVAYDPVADIVTVQSAVLPEEQVFYKYAAVSVSGDILCFAGSRSRDAVIKYDAAVDAIEVLPVILPSPRGGMACAADPISGRVYCFGGDYGSDLFDEILEYDVSLPSKSAALQVGNAGDGNGAIANAWRIFSSRDFKQGISPLQQQDYYGILDKLNATEVVRYSYRQDRSSTQHLGVIAEESPAEILGPDGKSVSLSDYISFLHAATKAQQQLIEDRDCRIGELESRLAELESAVSRLAEAAKEDER